MTSTDQTQIPIPDRREPEEIGAELLAILNSWFVALCDHVGPRDPAAFRRIQDEYDAARHGLSDLNLI